MACLFAFTFFRAFLDARKSFRLMPPDWAFGTCIGLSDLLLGGRPLSLTFFSEGAGEGTAATAFDDSGMGVAGFLGIGSGMGLPGSLSFVGILNETRGLFGGGPPVLKLRAALSGTLTAGSCGAISETGVLGRWSFTVGGVSSTGRIRISASLRIHQRTSWSTSGALHKSQQD